MAAELRISQVLPWIGEEEKQALMAVLDDNWLTEGPRSKEFSRRLNDLIGTEFGVFAPNGTLALVLGLMALNIGQGDEVMIPDTTFIASANAVLMTGAKPVFVDVEADTFQIDMTRAGDFLTPNCKAIMPVHLFGTSADMHAVQTFAEEHGLKVIEDAAQGIGVDFDGNHVGGIGDVGCFSFFADKTITTGEGGYVTCRNAETYERLLLVRNQGRIESGSFIHPEIGYNFRITDMQAAVGLSQLDRLDEIISRKHSILKSYQDGFGDIDQIRILGAAPKSGHVPFRGVLICEHSSDLSEHLNDNGIEARGFFYPLHRQPCFKPIIKVAEDAQYPNAIHGYEHGLLLPIYSALTEGDVERIISAIRQFYLG